MISGSGPLGRGLDIIFLLLSPYTCLLFHYDVYTLFCTIRNSSPCQSYLGLHLLRESSFLRNQFLCFSNLIIDFPIDDFCFLNFAGNKDLVAGFLFLSRNFP